MVIESNGARSWLHEVGNLEILSSATSSPFRLFVPLCPTYPAQVYNLKQFSPKEITCIFKSDFLSMCLHPARDNGHTFFCRTIYNRLNSRRGKVFQVSVDKASYVSAISWFMLPLLPCQLPTPNAVNIWQFSCTVVICSSNHKTVSKMILPQQPRCCILMPTIFINIYIYGGCSSNTLLMILWSILCSVAYTISNYCSHHHH